MRTIRTVLLAFVTVTMLSNTKAFAATFTETVSVGTTTVTCTDTIFLTTFGTCTITQVAGDFTAFIDCGGGTFTVIPSPLAVALGSGHCNATVTNTRTNTGGR
jgi:hypothetical protein